MKRVISLTVLIIVVLFGSQIVINMFTNSHAYKYVIGNNDLKFNISENYVKENQDSYSIEITNGNNTFYYAIFNDFNKQKKIITNVEYYKDGENICIYPVLKDNIPSYIECISDGSLYSGNMYSNQGFINEIKSDLKTKGYTLYEIDENSKSKPYSSMLVNTNYLNSYDSIVSWQYKGILVTNNKAQTKVLNNTFDKYDNKLGTLSGKYYVMPDYTNSNVLEFYSVTIVDLNSFKQQKLELGHALSSDTYLNGVVNGKIYYTDPSNLIQLEIDPKHKKVKLIGSNDLGGKKYANGKWEDANIYDFTNSEIKFNDIPQINYQYTSIVDGGACYYFTNGNEIYQLFKEHLDKPILIHRTNGINNLNAVNDEVFYVSGNTMYYLSNVKGNLPILIYNDLIYNTNNRVTIYRNK